MKRLLVLSPLLMFFTAVYLGSPGSSTAISGTWLMGHCSHLSAPAKLGPSWSHLGIPPTPVPKAAFMLSPGISVASLALWGRLGCSVHLRLPFGPAWCTKAGVDQTEVASLLLVSCKHPGNGYFLLENPFGAADSSWVFSHPSPGSVMVVGEKCLLFCRH